MKVWRMPILCSIALAVALLTAPSCRIRSGSGRAKGGPLIGSARSGTGKGCVRCASFIERKYLSYYMPPGMPAMHASRRAYLEMLPISGSAGVSPARRATRSNPCREPGCVGRSGRDARAPRVDLHPRLASILSAPIPGPAIGRLVDKASHRQVQRDLRGRTHLYLEIAIV